LVEVKGVGEFVKSHGSGLLGKGSLSSLDHSLSTGFTVVGLVFTVVGLVLGVFTAVVLSHVSLSSLAQGVLDVGVFTGVGGSLLEERPGTSVDDVTVFLVGFFDDGTVGLLVRDGDHLGVHLGNLLLVLLVVSLLVRLLVVLSVFTVVDLVGVFTSVGGLLEEGPSTSVDDGTVFLVGNGVVSMFTVVVSVVGMVGVFTVVVSVVSVVGVFTVVSSVVSMVSVFTVVVSVVGMFTVVVTVVGNVVFFTVVVGLLSKGNSSESEDGNSSHNERAE